MLTIVYLSPSIFTAHKCIAVPNLLATNKSLNVPLSYSCSQLGRRVYLCPSLLTSDCCIAVPRSPYSFQVYGCAQVCFLLSNVYMWPGLLTAQ